MELAVSLGPVGEWARSGIQRQQRDSAGCEATLGDPEQGRGGEGQAPGLRALLSGSPGSALRAG